MRRPVAVLALQGIRGRTVALLACVLTQGLISQAQAETMWAKSETACFVQPTGVPAGLGPSPDWEAVDTCVASIDGWRAIVYDAVPKALRALEACGTASLTYQIATGTPDCPSAPFAHRPAIYMSKEQWWSWACNRMSLSVACLPTQPSAHVGARGRSQARLVIQPSGGCVDPQRPEDAKNWDLREAIFTSADSTCLRSNFGDQVATIRTGYPHYYCVRTEFELNVQVFPELFASGELLIPSEDTLDTLRTQAGRIRLDSQGRPMTRVIHGRWAPDPTTAVIYVILHEIGHFESYVSRISGRKGLEQGNSEDDAWGFATSVAFCREVVRADAVKRFK